MKKGFTLIELMGVIVLLSILVIIAVPAVTGVLKSNKDKLYETQLKTIQKAGENWASDPENIDKLPENNGECIYISIETLKDDGYVDLDIKNPKTDRPFTNNTFVIITRSGKKLTFEAISNELIPDRCVMKS